MICPTCSKQIPDDAPACPFCGQPIDHQTQVIREISFRRYQRWFFYVLICVLFLGMSGVIYKLNKEYDATVASWTMTKEDLAQTQAAMETVQAEATRRADDLKKNQELIDGIQKQLTEKEKELAKKDEEFKVALGLASSTEMKLNADLQSINAGVNAMIVRLGRGISNVNLAKIPMAEPMTSSSTDSDSDGLADKLELALGTKGDNKDSDGDGYDDKFEVLRGFDPNSSQRLPIDLNFANAQKGAIFLQTESRGEAWYVNPADGKRYFLGEAAEAVKALANWPK